MLDNAEVNKAVQDVARFLSKEGVVDPHFAICVLLEVLISVVISGPQDKIDDVTEEVVDIFKDGVREYRDDSTVPYLDSGSMLQ